MGWQIKSWGWKTCFPESTMHKITTNVLIHVHTLWMDRCINTPHTSHTPTQRLHSLHYCLMEDAKTLFRKEFKLFCFIWLYQKKAGFKMKTRNVASTVESRRLVRKKRQWVWSNTDSANPVFWKKRQCHSNFFFHKN